MKPRTPRRRTTAQRLKALRRAQLAESPVETYAVVQQQLKGEDVLFVISDLKSLAKNRTDLGQWSIYALCDGHGGTTAAKFVRKYLASALAKVLPSGSPPTTPTDLCHEYCRSVRHALVKAFVSLHDAFGSEGCQTSGTTLSVCLVCDWLVTVANVADSEAFLIKGHSVLEMTNCHKVDDNKPEITRLQAGGADLRRLSKQGYGPASEGDAGRGPLRVWPGGLAMSRSIGDLYCDSHIVPVPHIRQMWVPKHGARLVMASDGLWDHVSGMKACRLIQSSPLLEAPQRLMRAAQVAANDTLSDDISILVLDLMPHEGLDFSERQSSQISILKSLKGYLSHAGKLKRAKNTDLVADEDGLDAFPDMTLNIIREICEIPTTSVESEEDSHSRNSSVTSENWDVCECSWDCSVDASTSWEKDDRDILDTAQGFVTGSSQSRPRPNVKIVVKQPVSRREVERSDLRDFLDTSMTPTEGTSMTTIHEPDGENEDTT